MTRDMRLIMGALLFWGVGEGLFFYFQPLYLEQLGASPIVIGGILGLAGAALMVAHIPAGILSDIVGRKPIMVFGWLIGVVSAVIMFLAPGLTIFAIGLVFYSFTGFVIAPLDSYITSARGKWTTARALSMSNVAFYLGLMIGSLFGGSLGELYGLKNVFAVASVFFIFSVALIALVRRQPIEAAQPEGRYRSLLRNKALASFLVLTFVAIFGLYLSWYLTPNYLQSFYDVSLTQIGFFGSMNALGLMMANLVLGRFPTRAGFLFAQFLVGASVLIFWQASAVPFFALGYFLAGGHGAAFTLAVARSEELVHRAQLGLTYGLVQTAGGLVEVLAPPIAGILYTRSPTLPFVVSLVIIAATIVVLIRRTAAAQLRPAVDWIRLHT